MNEKPVIKTNGASAIDRCNAVGVSETYWFIAVVKNNTDFSAQTKLKDKGYEAYVPYQNKTVIAPSGSKHIKKNSSYPNHRIYQMYRTSENGYSTISIYQ